MIYKDLHDIFKDEIDGFVYDSVSWVGNEHYKRLGFASFFNSQDNVIEFFTNFDFTPLLDELKEVNYVENLLKELCNTNSYFSELVDRRLRGDEFEGKTPQEKISVLAKMVLLDLLSFVFAMTSVFDYTVYWGGGVEGIVKFLKGNKYWFVGDVKKSLKNYILSFKPNDNWELEASLGADKFRIGQLLFLLEAVPINIVDTIIDAAQEQNKKRNIKFPNPQSVINAMSKGLELLYKRAPQTVNKDQLSYADYIEIINDTEEIKYRKILVNKILAACFVQDIKRWLKQNISASKMLKGGNIYDLRIITATEEQHPSSFYKVNNTFNLYELGIAPIILGRYLKVLKNYPRYVYEYFDFSRFERTLKMEFLIYFEKYFHKYFQYIFSSGEVSSSKEELSTAVERFRKMWLKVFETEGVPFFLIKNPDEILVYIVDKFNNKFLIDLSYLPDFLLPSSFKSKYPNLRSNGFLSLKNQLEKISFHVASKDFYEDWYFLTQKINEKIEEKVMPAC